MKLGINFGGSNEFRDAVVSGFLVGVVEMLSKLPETMPSRWGDVYSAVKAGTIAGIVFYLANKGIQLSKKGE